MDEAIVLSHLDTPTSKVDIRLSFEGEDLVLDGYDRGDATHYMTADEDYDYEYRIVVAASSLTPLYHRFGLLPEQKRTLLESVANEIGGPKAYTLFLEMLVSAGVPFRTWSA